MNQIGLKKPLSRSVGNKMSGGNVINLGHKQTIFKSSRSVIPTQNLADGIVNHSNDRETTYEPHRYHVPKPPPKTFNIEKPKKPTETHSHFV